MGLPRTKHLAPITKGETVLSRLLKQFGSAGIETFVVSNNPDIIEKYPECYVPADNHILAATLISTSDHWADRTWIIYGDVVFSRAAFQQVIHPISDFTVWGFPGSKERWSEIYGYCFTKDHQGEMFYALKDEIAYEDANQPRRATHEIYDRIKDFAKYDCIPDWTCDVDFVGYYLKTRTFAEKEEHE
jgi:hypothetical protein